MKKKTAENSRFSPEDSDFWNRLKKPLERLILQPSPENALQKTAVFDLDNTLLSGDIGDALLAYLNLNPELAPHGGRHIMSFPRYRRMCAGDEKQKAYSLAVTSMTGMTPARIRAITLEVMNLKTAFISLEEEKIPVPVPDPVMQEMVSMLIRHHVDCHIISASNHFSVCAIGETYFGISPAKCRGIKPVLKNNSRGEPAVSCALEDPVTYGTGKAVYIKNRLPKIIPLISAGDSPGDLDMLALTADNGLVIWKGSAEYFNRQRRSLVSAEIVFSKT